MANSGPRVPEFKITKVNNTLHSYVKKVTVDYVADGPDMFSVTFLNQSAESPSQKPVFTHQDGAHFGHFKAGDEITIECGFKEGSMEKMIQGELTGIEGVFREHDPSMFIIRGFDKLHRLSRGRKQRTFLDMKDSDIASQIAQEMGLQTDIDDSGQVHDHVFQNNLSNIDFLYARARAIGFEVDVTETKLKFKKPQVDGSSVTELIWQDNLKRARFYLSTAHQVSEVQVRGWDPQQKKEIVGKAKVGDEYSKMGGSKTGGQLSKGNYGQGDIVSVVCNAPLKTMEEANAIAKARFNELAMNFITGKAEIEGDMSIKAGVLVKFKEVGDQFDGLYYVTNAVHTIRPGSGPGTGYTTRFSFKRAGVNTG